jgi:hypothetical protein
MTVDAPAVAGGSTAVGPIAVSLLNDSMANGVNQQTDITISSWDMHLFGTEFGGPVTFVITPGSTHVLNISLFIDGGVTAGHYTGSVTVSGVNDFGKNVQAKAGFRVFVASLGAAPILDGPNGICESAASGDDVQVIPVGQGLADSVCVSDGNADNTVAAPVGDDKLLPTGCAQGVNCNGVSSGPDGICDTTTLAGDTQVIPVGQGQPDQLCVNVGPNGLLDTVLGGDDTN